MKDKDQSTILRIICQYYKRLFRTIWWSTLTVRSSKICATTKCFHHQHTVRRHRTTKKHTCTFHCLAKKKKKEWKLWKNQSKSKKVLTGLWSSYNYKLEVLLDNTWMKILKASIKSFWKWGGAVIWKCSKKWTLQRVQ